MPFQPENITKEHIIAAVARIESEGIQLTPATKFAVLINGKEYAPKEIMRYAHEEMNGERVWEYSGGEPTHKFLEKFGFKTGDKGTLMSNLDYRNLERAVFKYLSSLHEKNNDFTFSVRRKGSKGAECDIFIGTENSNYFLFTLWEIPIEYPGASNDLIDYGVFIKENQATVSLSCLHSINTAYNKQQSELNLKFLDFFEQQIKPLALKHNWDYKGLNQDAKTRRIEINAFQGLKNQDQIIDSLKTLISVTQKVVNETIDKFKKANSKWEGRRISPKEFDQRITKLKERLKKYECSGFDEYTKSSLEKINLVTMNPLNQILFGPPGTGKTYNTVNEALQIADPVFYEEYKENRKALTDRFNELLINDWDNPKGQIAFCTFHQSFSYEDFVEGIKPEVLKDKNDLVYRIKDGVFKLICKQSENADNLSQIKEDQVISLNDDDFNKASFYKISLGDVNDPDDNVIYQYCLKNDVIALGFGDENDFTGLDESQIKSKVAKLNLSNYAATALNYFSNYLKKGNYVVIPKGLNAIRAIGVVKDNYEYNPETEIRYNHFRKVDWLFKDVEISVEDFYEHQLSQKTIYKLDKNLIKRDFFINNGAESIAKQELTEPRKNYVLIIDEINRGNVSSIFGELITLIEDNKRRGQDESLSVTLPYSKKPFSVPDNVFLIGTMNTADRSVEALDTALRRRFTFKPMFPLADLLGPGAMFCRLLWKYVDVGWSDKEYAEKEKELLDFLDANDNIWDNRKAIWDNMKNEGRNDQEQAKYFIDDDFTGINLKKLLLEINKRIEKLLDQDHCIGHSYFMSVSNIDALKHVFANKILPLLEEYFYGDFGKIGLVLGESFIEKNEDKAVFATFAGYDDDVKTDLAVKAIFKIKPQEDWNFNSIYE